MALAIVHLAAFRRPHLCFAVPAAAGRIDTPGFKHYLPSAVHGPGVLVNHPYRKAGPDSVGLLNDSAREMPFGVCLPRCSGRVAR